MIRILILSLSLLLVSVISFGQLTGDGSQGNPYSGDLSSDITWDASNDIYVNGIITIPSGRSLTINASDVTGGITIHISNQVDIINNGTLTITGTPTDSVKFTSASPDRNWGHIVFNENSNGSIIYSSFENGHSLNGGAIYLNTANPVTINNSTFRNNSVQTSGNTIPNNSIEGAGGAIYIASGTGHSIRESSFEMNSATFSSTTNQGFEVLTAVGGAIFVGSNSFIDINGCTFAHNIISGENINYFPTSRSGGAIFLVGTATITNSLFFENSATAGGGAICFSGFNGASKGSIVSNCIFDSNVSYSNDFSFSGGAMAIIFQSSADVTNCTFVNNSTENLTTGDALKIHYGNDSSTNTVLSRISNCVFWSSSMNTDESLISISFSDEQSLRNAFSYCAFMNNWPILQTDAFAPITILENLSNSFIISNDNTEMGSGPFFKAPTNHDWSIQMSSQLLNAGGGDNATSTDYLGKDIVGGSRDIGAYELQYAMFTETASANPTTTIDGVTYHNFYNGDNWTINPFDNDNNITMDICIPADGNDAYINGTITIPLEYNFNIYASRTVTLAPGTNIIVNGFLNTYGNENSNVIFTRSESTGNWGHIEYQSNSNGTLNYSTIEYGSSDTGGALYLNTTGVIDVNNVTFSDNSATASGGAIHVASGTPTISNSIFSNNSASNGGAIYNIGTTTINASSFNNNEATNGGALYLANGTVSLTATTFSSNSANDNGGSIYINDGALEVTGFGREATSTSLFGENSATSGGAVYVNGGTSSFSNTFFSSNNATTGGGAVTLASSSSGSFINCVFDGNITTGNTAATTGGAMTILTNGNTAVTNCTFVNNTSTYQHGGIILLSGATSTSITNSVFWSNSATSSIYSTSPLTSIISYCAFSDLPVVNGDSFTDIASINSISISHTNDDMGTPSGPFFNDPMAHNWSILSTSPLRNAGDPQIAIGDILGKNRNNIRDIGSYEAPYAQFVGGSIQTLTGTNYYDFTAGGNWSDNPFDNTGALIMDLGVSHLDNARLYINDDISITSGYSLTIDTGTTVAVGEGYDITIENNAALIVNGTTDNVATFTKVDVQADNWGHIVFQPNSSGRINGGIFEYGSALITGNIPEGLGGVFYINSNNVNISNSIFRNNTATTGGAIYLASEADILNCIFEANSSNGNGGAIATTSTTTANITNCTFVNNTALNGNALYASNANTNIVNSIFWNSSPENNNQYQIYNVGAGTAISYSAYTSAYNISPSNSIVLGYENQGLNPKGPFFKNTNLDEGEDDWSILVISPLRDAGDPNSTSIEGINGQELIYRRDIGAYEARYARFYGNELDNSDGYYKETYYFRNPANWINPQRPDENYYPFELHPSRFNSRITTMDIVIPDCGGTYVPSDGVLINKDPINRVDEREVAGNYPPFIEIAEGLYVVVEPQGKLIIAQLINNGTIRLQSDKKRTGSFRSIYNADRTAPIPGKFEIELFLSGGSATEGGDDYKWHYIASPIPNLSTNTFTGENSETFGESNFNLATYYQEEAARNENIHQGWIAYDGYRYSDGTDGGNTFNTLSTGKGYNYYYKADTMFLLSGNSLWVNDYDVPLTYDENNNGWNLIGNPYSVGIDIEGLYPQNSQLFTQSVDFGTGEVHEESAYLDYGVYYTKNNVQHTYCSFMTTPLPEGSVGYSDHTNFWNQNAEYNEFASVIPPMQGFFMRLKQATDIPFHFVVGAKVHDFPELYKGDGSSSSKKTFYSSIPMLRLALVSDSSYFDDTVLRFTLKQTTTATNDTLDTFKTFKSKTNNLISTTLQDIEYAIKSMPYPEETTFQVPVNIQIVKSGKYTIGVKEIQNLDGYQFSLKDNLTGYSTELNERTPYIKFTSEAGDFPERFTLFITNRNYITSVKNVNSDTDEDINIYYSNDKINIIPVNGTWNNTPALVSVYDLAGRLVSTHGEMNLSTNIIVEIPAPKTHGAYLVEIKGKGRKIVGKIVR